MRPLFVIGYMGAGKSTLAQALHEGCGLDRLDTDAEVERLTGMSCRELIAARGMEAFRRQERRVLQGLEGRENVVVATGGGLPVWQDNMELMNRLGRTLYLRWNAANLALRIELSGVEQRPLLEGRRGEALRTFVERHLAEREPFYLRARHVMECDGLWDDDIYRQAARLLGF